MLSPYWILGENKLLLSCPEIDKKRINAPAAYRLASSLKTPWGVLKRANDLWRHEHPDTSYSGSYRAMTPESWFDHELGLITSSAIASHILRAYNKNKSKPAVRCLVSKECHCDDKLERVGRRRLRWIPALRTIVFQ